MSTIGIEALLRWAFVMELTKGDNFSDGPASSASAWAIVERIGELGTMVDTCGAPLGHGDDEPHPDALVIAEAVEALDDEAVEEGEDHDLLAGWPDFGLAGEEAVARAWAIVTRVEDGRRWLRSPLSSLVRRAAILGLWPEWKCDQPEATVAVGPEGRPKWFRVVRIAYEWGENGVVAREADVEIDGYDRVSQRPYKGAYRKGTLSPDPSSSLARRIEYGLTHAALRTLATRLDGLGGRRISAPNVPAVPWANG